MYWFIGYFLGGVVLGLISGMHKTKIVKPERRWEVLLAIVILAIAGVPYAAYKLVWGVGKWLGGPLKEKRDVF